MGGSGAAVHRARAAMLDRENASLRDRVAALEARAGAQGGQLQGLRAGLADCLRRLASVEADRGAGAVPAQEGPSQVVRPRTSAPPPAGPAERWWVEDPTEAAPVRGGRLPAQRPSQAAGLWRAEGGASALHHAPRLSRDTRPSITQTRPSTPRRQGRARGPRRRPASTPQPRRPAS
jgi:hypothetical protein